MAARLVQPNEAIEVKSICTLIFGEPGARKSSLTQTASNPFTIATDPGIYRAFGRKACALVETWADVQEVCSWPNVLAAGTVVVDTVGMALEKLGNAVIAESAKHGNRNGGLSLQGYGVLKTRFASWVSSVRERGQDIVFTAHQKDEKAGDEVYHCPDIVGGSYNTLMNHCDVVGYMHYADGKRVIDFSPTDRWMAKCPPCGWGQIVLPDFGTDPHFLARLLSEAKASMGRVSEQSAKVADMVNTWQMWLAEPRPLDQFNLGIKDLADVPQPAKTQCWHLILATAQARGWTFDKASKMFVEVPKENTEAA